MIKMLLHASSLAIRCVRHDRRSLFVHIDIQFDIISRFLNGASREAMPSMELDRTDDDRLTLPSSTTRKSSRDDCV